MKHVPTYLSSSFRKIMKSPVLRDEITDVTILQLEELLNNALPQAEEHYSFFLFIKELYHNNKNKFLRFIDNSEYNCFVLWTDNKTIMNHLNLRRKVYIKWEQETKKYRVARYTERATDQPNQVEQVDVEMSE